jgi:hypothetical protein
MNKNNFADALVIGKWAALATSAALMALGAREKRQPIAPVNAVSHIAWGDEAYEQLAPSVKYSFTGLALNAAAMVSWAVALEVLLGRFARRDATSAVASGAAISALAYVVDYHVVPERLMPGFEKHLSNRSLFAIYVVLALSLAGGVLASRK